MMKRPVWSNIAFWQKDEIVVVIPERFKFRPVNNNNNNNNHDDIYSALIYGASHMPEFTAVHRDQSRTAPGGRQLVGQAADLTFESACIGCYRPNIRPSPCIITQQ